MFLLLVIIACATATRPQMIHGKRHTLLPWEWYIITPILASPTMLNSDLSSAALTLEERILSVALFQSTYIPATEGFIDDVLESLPSEGEGLNLALFGGRRIESHSHERDVDTIPDSILLPPLIPRLPRLEFGLIGV